MNKIDLIIENIEYAKILKESAHQDELLEEALAAARELKALKPVAWVYINEDGECEQIEYGSEGCDDPAVQPLYALDEVKHD